MTLIYKVDTPGMADFSVQEVQAQSLADLLVCRSETQTTAMRNPGVWCFIEKRTPFSKAIHFLNGPGIAQLKVHYVSSPSLSGWVRPHRLKGRL